MEKRLPPQDSLESPDCMMERAPNWQNSSGYVVGDVENLKRQIAQA
jgi:hypothetical protein